MGFTALGLSEKILEGVRAMGWVDPTPIQLRGIPLVLAGRDVIGSAQTGTGKTAAFGLPILSKLAAPAPADEPVPDGHLPPREGATTARSHPPGGDPSSRRRPGPRALVLEPTRELAAQVETALRDY